MSRVLYGPDSEQKRLIPAPFVNINKTYQKSGNGEIIGRLYTITLTGTIVAHMGSPHLNEQLNSIRSSDGNWWATTGYPDDEVIASDARLNAIMRKQQAIRNLFSNEGQILEIQSADGSQSFRCNPRLVSIEFPEDLWYERSNYVITLECDDILGLEDSNDFDQYISDATESWDINTNEEYENFTNPTYNLSHTVSAVGKRFYDTDGSRPKEPWEYARDFVLSKIGIDSDVILSTDINNLPSYYNGWNHTRTEQRDEQGGSFAVTENWLLASGSAIEDFNVNYTHSSDTVYDRVTIQGSVRGFEERDSNMAVTTDKWTNAQDKFIWASGIAYTRAKEYSGLNTLNIGPLSMLVGRNPYQGTIEYTFDYDTRPMNLIEGARSEVISVNDNMDGELFASVFVLGRTDGPVLQDLGTKPANTRTLNIEIVVDPPRNEDRELSTMRTLLISEKPSNADPFRISLERLIEAVDPSEIDPGVISYQDQSQESWEVKEGRYTYTTTWTYE